MGATHKILANLSDRAAKRKLLEFVGKLQGWQEVVIKERVRVRTRPQNAWYWAVIVPAVVVALGDFWGERHKPTAVHEMLKDRFLTREIMKVDPETGKVRLLRTRRRSRHLSTQEFSEYCEQCRDLLAEWFNVMVPDPDPDWRYHHEEF